MKKLPVVCLMGPTASGKTEVAMRLADKHPLDIISVDSALVYRGMNIGTAKPDVDTLHRYPHRLVDIRDPEDSYSAGEFVNDANQHIDAIHATGRVPLLVGGTMMYFRALTEGIADLPAANAAMRESIDREAAAIGWPAMHAQLASIDAPAAARINANDAQRIQRALEVYRISGRALTDWQAHTPTSRHSFLKVALLPEPRSKLHARIESRLNAMLDNDFITEIKLLMKRNELSRENSSMRAVGYRQFWAHLLGEISFEDAFSAALAATRQLAKRQLTWLRSEPDLLSINPLETDAAATISKHLEKIVFINRSSTKTDIGN